MINGFYIKVIIEIDIKSIAKIVKVEKLVIKDVVVNEVDKVNKYRNIALL